MSSADLRAKVTSILGEDAVRKIDFALGGLRVTGDRLGEVGRAVSSGRIHVFHNPAQAHAAEYRPDKDAIILQSDAMGGRYEQTHRSMIERSVVVHEATHAVIDMHKAMQTRQLANEAAAYLAQALYLYTEMGEVSYSHWIDQGVFPEDIHRACLALIKKRPLVRGGVTLGDAEYMPIMLAIKADPTYAPIAWTDTEGGRADGLARPEIAPRSSGCGCSMVPIGISPRTRLRALGGVGRLAAHTSLIASAAPGAVMGFAAGAAGAAGAAAGLAAALTAGPPTIRARVPTVPTPQWLSTRLPAPFTAAGAFSAGPVGPARAPWNDPYSSAMWGNMSRVRPTDRVGWMQANHSLAYQQHLANADLLRRTVGHQFTSRNDPYSSAMWRDMSRVRPTDRVGWMQANHPLAYQQHLADVGLLNLAAQQLR